MSYQQQVGDRVELESDTGQASEERVHSLAICHPPPPPFYQDSPVCSLDTLLLLLSSYFPYIPIHFYNFTLLVFARTSTDFFSLLFSFILFF